MSALDDARVHLAKAREYLAAADLSHDAKLYDAAISNAVISGVNSKDAICLRLTRTTGKSDRHDDAIGELEAAGVATKYARTTERLATVLSLLLSVKGRAQYAPILYSRAGAEAAIEQAQELLTGATTIVT